MTLQRRTREVPRGAVSSPPTALSALRDRCEASTPFVEAQQARIFELHALVARADLPAVARARSLAEAASALHDFDLGHGGATGTAVLTGLGEALAQFDGPPTLALLGTFNAGKSSVLNALLGDTLAVEDVEPTTAVTASYHRGPEPDVKVLGDHGWERITLDEYRGLTHVGSHRVRTRSIRAARVEHPSVVLKDLVLVDTPGFAAGHRAGLEDEDRARAHIRNAGAFVWVVDCHRGLQDGDLAALAALPRDGRLRFAVLNKADQKPPRECLHIQEAFRRDHGHHFDGVFLFSARLRQRREAGESLPSGLVQHLDLDWDRKVLADVRAAANVLRARSLAARLKHDLSAASAAVEQARVERERRVQKLEALDPAEKSAEAVDELGSRLEREIERVLARFVRDKGSQLWNATRVNDGVLWNDEPEIHERPVNGLREAAFKMARTLEATLEAHVVEGFEAHRRGLVREVVRSLGAEGRSLAKRVKDAGAMDLLARATHVPVAFLEGCIAGLDHLSWASPQMIRRIDRSPEEARLVLEEMLRPEAVVGQLRWAVYGNQTASCLDDVGHGLETPRSAVERAMRSVGFPIYEEIDAVRDDWKLAARAALLDDLLACTETLLVSLGGPDASA